MTRPVETKLRLDVSEYVRNLRVAGAATREFARTVEQSAARATAAMNRMNQQTSQSQQRASRTRLTQAQRDQQAMNQLHAQALREDAARTRAATQQRAAADRSMTRMHEAALRENAARDRAAAASAARMNALHAQALRENAARQAAADQAAAAAATRRAQSVQQVSKAAMVGGAVLVAGWAMSVNAAMKFEKQISAVGAAANATGKDLDALREAALQAGADTAFSATEAAEGEEELAKAGVELKDILNGGLRGALDLASAGQLSVAESAEIAATAMTQFQLRGSQVPHVADLLSAGANKAQGSVHDLGASLKMGGLVASQFGWSVEETVGTLAMFAKAGLIGSDAGTSMKQMLLMLVNPTKKAAKLMEELGIHTYDANGQFVHAEDLAGQLQKRLGGLSEEQRNQALATIFGADAIRGASIAFKNGAEGVKDWEENVNDSGNAARTAAAKLDNLAGDLEKLKGSLETGFIKSGSTSMGPLRLLTQSVEHMVDGFAEAPAAVSGTGMALAATTGAALLAAGAYGVMAPKIRLASAALVGMGTAGRVANTALMGIGKWGGIALGAILALNVASTAFGSSASLAAGELGRYSKALAEFGKTGEVSTKASTDLAANMKHLSHDASIFGTSNWMKASTSIASFAETITMTGGVLDETVEHARERMANLDQGLAELVRNGNADEAAAAMERIIDTLREAGYSAKELDQVRRGFKGYNSAVKDAGEASKQAASSMETAAGKARVMASGMEVAVKEAGSLDKALHQLNDTAMNAFDATNAYQLGLNKLTQSLKDNHKAWAGNTTAAVENRQAVGDQIKSAQDAIAKKFEETSATRGQAAAMAEATASYRTMRAQIIHAAVAAGINTKAVTALVDALFQVPSNTPAKVSAPGAVKAKAEVGGLNAEIKRVQDKIAKVSVSGAPQAVFEVQGLRRQLALLQSKQIRIGITQTYSYNGPQIPIKGVPGIDKSRWGNVYSFAGGGVRQAKVAKAGTLVQWAEPETGGEAYVPRRGDPGRSRAIIDEAASWYGGQVAYSGTPSMAGATVATSAGGGGGGGNTYVIHQTVAPGGDLRRAGQQIVECIQQYEQGGGRSWRTRT